VSNGLGRADIESGLATIGAKAAADGRLIELAVYGGAAIVLAFDFRKATRDVGAVITGDPAALRRYAVAVADERGWDRDRLNDAVKGFVSARSAENLRLFRSYPSEGAPGLRVFVPTAEYLLAMKCLAMRIAEPDGGRDLVDILQLMRITGLTTKDALVELIEGLYPRRLITPRVAFGIEQIAEEYRERGDALQAAADAGGGSSEGRAGRRPV
jgi:hypothetical protein